MKIINHHLFKFSSDSLISMSYDTVFVGTIDEN